MQFGSHAKNYIESKGWIFVSECPLEIKYIDGSIATETAARMIINIYMNDLGLQVTWKT
jgi:hypothetical protein